MKFLKTTKFFAISRKMCVWFGLANITFFNCFHQFMLVNFKCLLIVFERKANISSQLSFMKSAINQIIITRSNADTICLLCNARINLS